MLQKEEGSNAESTKSEQGRGSAKITTPDTGALYSFSKILDVLERTLLSRWWTSRSLCIQR